MKITMMLLVIVAARTINAHMRVCYYSNWSQYRQKPGRFWPEDIDPHLCTHLIYSFAKLENNQLGKYEENDESLYYRFNKLKQKNPNLKTLLAVGGWTAGSTPFSTLAANPSLRKTFASTSVTYLRKYTFDGLDMDWEYPAHRGGSYLDKRNFVLLLKDLKEEFQRDAIARGQPRLLLTAAVSAGKSTIDTAYDIPGINMYLDFINLMSYDLHGGWESFTGHNSPLYSRSSEQWFQAYLNVDWAARHWRDNGTPAGKLNIGLPTYGRTFNLQNPSNNGMGAPAFGGGGTMGNTTGETGFLSYYEICWKLANNEGSRIWHNEHKVPYLVDGNQWIGYDDEESIAMKLTYIRDNGFGGAMVWNLDLDDFRQSCSLSSRKYPLMSLMKEILDKYVPSTNPPATNNPETDTTPTTTEQITTTTNEQTGGPQDAEFCSNKADGLYRDSQDCNKYYHCYIRVTFHKSCQVGLYFNPSCQCCDYPYNVDCTAAPTQKPISTSTQSSTATSVSTTRPPNTQPPTTQPPTTQSPTTQPSTTRNPATGQPDPDACIGRMDGLYKVPSDCSKYYHCVNEITYIIPCQAGTLFNPSIKACDWEQNVDCSDLGPKTDFCADKSDGLYWYPYDCAKYYNCGSFITYIYTCAPGTLFDSDIKNCDWKYNVDCKGAPAS